jgi:hypothetical protein
LLHNPAQKAAGWGAMSVLKFLNESTKIDTLLQIRREIEGEDDEEDEDEMEEEDDPTEKVRKPSKTVFDLLRKYGAIVDGFRSDWPAFLAFFREHTNQICDIKDLETLDNKLKQIREYVEYSHRILSKSLRNNFSDVISIAKEYMAPRYTQEKFDLLVNEHWRKIVCVSKEVLKMQVGMKDVALTFRTSHMYEIDWDTYHGVLRILSAPSFKPQEELERKDVVMLLCAVEGNIACRKSEVLDPTITFQSFTKWRKENGNTGLPSSTDFILGDEREGLKLDEDRAIQEFREINIIVQFGRLKDATQRNIKYGPDAGEELVRTNAIIRRPCLLFSAQDTCKMVTMIRRYFKLTLSSRPEGPGARREIGSIVTSRDVRHYVLEPYLPQIVAHAKKWHMSLGSHWFRSAAANFLAEIYENAINRASGHAIHRQHIMKTLLSHQGSVHTAMSYANVKVTMPRTVPELSVPLEQRLLIQQQTIDDLLKQVMSLNDRMNSIKPVEEHSDMVEFSRVDGTKVSVRKRNDTTRHKTAADRDAAIHRVIDVLQTVNVEPNITNLKKMGFGSDTLRDFKLKLPLSATASARRGDLKTSTSPVIEPVQESVVLVDRPLRERGTHVSNLREQLDPGDKVVLTKPNSTENAKKQQLKRGLDTFSGVENRGMILESDADCEGRIATKVVKTDKGRNLPVRVCEEDR